MYAIRCSTCAILTLFLAVICSGAAAQQPAGFADPILGRWDLTVTDVSGDTAPSWLEIRLRTEGELMGRFVGRVGSVRHLPEISWRDDELMFTAPIQYERGSHDLQFG